MREFDIECLITALERVRALAVRVGLDAHVIAEIEHLIATAEANR